MHIINGHDVNGFCRIRYIYMLRFKTLLCRVLDMILSLCVKQKIIIETFPRFEICVPYESSIIFRDNDISVLKGTHTYFLSSCLICFLSLVFVFFLICVCGGVGGGVGVVGYN